jgi:hypothetical protein
MRIRDHSEHDLEEHLKIEDFHPMFASTSFLPVFLPELVTDTESIFENDNNTPSISSNYVFPKSSYVTSDSPTSTFNSTPSLSPNPEHDHSYQSCSNQQVEGGGDSLLSWLSNDDGQQETEHLFSDDFDFDLLTPKQSCNSLIQLN